MPEVVQVLYFLIYLWCTKLLLSGGDQSINFVEVIFIYFNFIQEVEVKVFGVRFTAEFNLLPFNIAHL